MRNPALAKIHIAKKQLRMDDDVYRAMLQQVANVQSAAALDARGIEKVLKHMEALGAKFTKGKFQASKRTTPAKDKTALASKIKALLADGKYPDTYADSMAMRMFGVERWEWLPAEELFKLIGALAIHQRRQNSDG